MLMILYRPSVEISLVANKRFLPIKSSINVWSSVNLLSLFTLVSGNVVYYAVGGADDIIWIILPLRYVNMIYT